MSEGGGSNKGSESDQVMNKEEMSDSNLQVKEEE